MKFFFTFFLLISMAHADVASENIENMLEQMVKENVISASEATKAKLRKRSLRSRGPASIASMKGSDLDRAQIKQIQDDIKKIVPDYRD